MTGALLSARGLHVAFRIGNRRLVAVDGVDIRVERGETVGLVGESGSGKSTLARALMRVQEPEAGTLTFDGVDYTSASGSALRAVRRRMQMIFQDPYSSLDPRWTVGRIVAEGLVAHGVATPAERIAKVAALLQAVGLPADAAGRLPRQFSGGQRQRIAIARALALEPDLLIADEPVSALDVSIQAQIVELLMDLQQRLGIAILLIAHDLALVYQVTHRVVVLYLGRVVEEGDTVDVVSRPFHPYTAALLAATPDVRAGSGGQRMLLPGEPPSALDPPSGCRFHPRCPVARPSCAVNTPPLVEVSPRRKAACFHPGEVAATGAGIR